MNNIVPHFSISLPHKINISLKAEKSRYSSTLSLTLSFALIGSESPNLRLALSVAKHLLVRFALSVAKHLLYFLIDYSLIILIIKTL